MKEWKPSEIIVLEVSAEDKEKILKERIGRIVQQSGPMPFIADVGAIIEGTYPGKIIVVDERSHPVNVKGPFAEQPSPFEDITMQGDLSEHHRSCALREGASRCTCGPTP